MAPEPFYNLEELEGLARKVLPDMVRSLAAHA